MEDKLKLFYKELDTRYAKGDLEQVEQFLLHCVKDVGEKQEQETGIRIAVYNELGSFFRGISRFDQSIQMFQYAQELVCAELGYNSVQHATVMNNMAGTYRIKGDYASAIRLFEQSLKIYRGCGEEKQYTFASVLNNLALAYRENHQISKAIEYLEQALELIEHMPERKQETAITYHNLAALYLAAGDQDMASQCVNHAISIFEQCADEENVHYAAALNSLAGILYAQNDCEKALQLYWKSLTYTKRFFGENLEYGITFRNMYWVYKKMGRRKDAIAALEQAYQIFERLLGTEHERTCAVADDLRRLKEEELV